ncbi:MAG: glycosyltransferase family 2 protein [Muribaculaceae bacterium]|nr:glycosyltransferase family 2 protein [Muribaculaceae bacterium]
MLSVVILNWNGVRLLRQFLPSVVENTVGDDVEVVVADNGSTDSSPAVIRSEFPTVRLLCFDRNYGYAAGYNKAISEIDSEFVVLLNSDVETPPGWWRPLLDFMKGNPKVGACQPKIKSWRDKSSFEYAGAAGGLLDSLGYPYCRGRVFDHLEKDMGQYDGAPADIAWASGAALMVRREAYLKVGGLDERFFAHMEEIDLCCRMHNAGWRVCFVPDSEVFHLGGASLAQGNPMKTYLNFRNNLLLLLKNLPPKKARSVLLKRRLMDTLAFLMFLAKLDFRNAGSVVKAHRDFRRMRSAYSEFPERDVLGSLPGADRNIVIDRYLKGIKTYTPGK